MNLQRHLEPLSYLVVVSVSMRSSSYAQKMAAAQARSSDAGASAGFVSFEIESGLMKRTVGERQSPRKR